MDAGGLTLLPYGPSQTRSTTCYSSPCAPRFLELLQVQSASTCIKVWPQEEMGNCVTPSKVPAHNDLNEL
eukprot:4859417-Amphidinium_carterae.1